MNTSTYYKYRQALELIMNSTTDINSRSIATKALNFNKVIATKTQEKLRERQSKAVFQEQYHMARHEHAFRLRNEGLSYADIGKRLGVSRKNPKFMIYKYERDQALAARKATNVTNKVDPLELHIDDLGLSVRSRNCLFNENIYTVKELLQKPEWELLRVPNFGLRSLDEIKNALAALGVAKRQPG